MPRHIRLLVPLAAVLVVAMAAPVLIDAALRPRPAHATFQNNCTNLVRVSVHGSYELYQRLCVNQADDDQSLRAYMGWECRFGGVRHNQCRVSMPHLKLWMDGTNKRDNNMGTYPPAPGFAAGTSWYGDWYNYPGLCWPIGTNWWSSSEGGSVRYDDGFLDADLDDKISVVDTIGCLG